MKYVPIEIEINGETKKAYRVEDLNPKTFRGLQICVLKKHSKWNHWAAYEITTGTTLMPISWSGSYNNKTRDATMEIVAYRLSKLSELNWQKIQEHLDYKLEKPKFRWGEISIEVWQTQNDITDACNLAPSNRHGEKAANATELDQYTIDEIYNFLGTAVTNAQAAMKKLHPETTYFKQGS